MPETIEWNDGTKVNLAHNDSSTTLVDDQAAAAAAAAAKEQEEAAKKAKVPPPKPVTTVGPNATVLRLGSNSQPRTGGLVLKTPSDKPTLVAKPSAPTPVRSPWAQLPPVDKVPPVPINPPAQTAVSRFQQNEPYGGDISTTPSSTTVEIPADSFTRTRRDTQAGTHGQLYNSQSGQYETVSAPRRGSIRKDQNFRPPSLLQRPSPSDQQAPAEPSPAFQTHRSGTQQDHSLWNRRESSTVSNDSGPQGRRASISKSSDIPRVPLELLQQRRESQPLQSPSTSGHSQVRQAHSDIHGAQNQYPQPIQSGVNAQLPHDLNSATTATQQQMAGLSGNTAPSHMVNDIAVQKQLMREKRELAIKRKKEEEEREEAEKRERIRIRMEKMGLAPLVEKKEPEKVAVEQTSKEANYVEDKVLEPKVAKPIEVPTQVSDSKPSEAVAPVPRSPPKPPVPDSSGTPKQYGLMKLHGPAPPVHLNKGRVSENRSKIVAPVEQSVPVEQNGRNEQNTPIQQNVPAVQESARVQEIFTEPKISPSKANVATGSKGSESIIATHSENLDNKNNNRIDNINQDLFNGPRHPKPWKSIQNEEDAFAGWNGAAGMTTHSSPGGNLWGPPNSYKSLGNGTFDRSVQRPQSRPLVYQENYLPTQPLQPPQPIGPPKHLQRPRESPESNHTSDHTPSAIAEDFQTIPTFPSSDTPSSHLAPRSDNLNQTSKMEVSTSPPQPNLPIQAKPVMNPERVTNPQEYTRTTLTAWGTFHITSAKEDQEKRRQAAHEETLRLAEEERTGIRRQLELPAMNETWRQVKVDDRSSNRQVVSVARKLTSASAQQVNGDITNPSYSNPSNLMTPAGTGRGSRFFPSIGQHIPVQEPQALSYSTTYSRFASPPPPESENHPAYFRDHQRPLVNLPISRPKPTVRLPPPGVVSLQPPVMPVLPSVQTVPLRAAISQPLVNNPSWQDRFDGLLGNKKPQPEKKTAHVNDFSATKVPLDVPTAQVSTAVALPPKGEKTAEPKYDGGVTSKATEDEEALFENREFGSLPTVLIPAKAPEAVQQSLKAGKNGKNFHNRVSRYKEVDSETVKSLEDKANEGPNGILIFVKMTGMREKRSATMPLAKTNNNFNTLAQRNRHVSSGSKAGKGFKPRESNGNFNQKVAPIGAQRIAMPNGVIPQPRNQFPKQNPHWNANTRVAHATQ